MPGDRSRGPTSDDLVEALLRHAAEPVLLTALDGTVVRASEAACRALGHTEAELVALGREGIVVPTPELPALLAERAERGAASGELTLRRADGTTFPVEFTSTVVPAGDDGVPFTLTTFRDMSERRRLARELRDSEELFRAAFLLLPDAVMLTDETTSRYLAANDNVRRLSGWEREELVGRTAFEVGFWEDPERAAFMSQLQRYGAVQDYRTVLQRKDGGRVEVSVSARRVELARRTLLLSVARDLSEQRSAERARDSLQDQLRQSQKMEAVGRLAGGVAHDFNNLLTVILGAVEALREDTRRQAPASEEIVGEISTAALRARELTGQLLAFARKDAFAPVVFRPDEAVARAERLLRGVLGEDVDLMVAVPAAGWSIRADPGRLEQVLLNLAVNARDAMPSGGKLLVETQDVVLDEVAAAPFPGAAPGRYVRLRVQDNGTGMAPEVRERAFEPFFTTKPEGKGSGLGLSVVHGIVAQAGGFIWIESAPRFGTTVELIFPAVDGEAPAAPAPALAGRGGPETVLLVDDDRVLLDVAARSLRLAGYRVLTAGGAREALAVAADEPGIALLVSDVVMPDRNGRQLADALGAARPGLPVLFITGYPPDVVHRKGFLDASADVLEKPFTGSALRDRVRAALDRAVAARRPA